MSPYSEGADVSKKIFAFHPTVSRSGNCKPQTSEDEHKFTQLRGLVGEGPLREKLRKMSEDEPQVYSIKKTCGSEFEDMRKAAQSVPLQTQPPAPYIYSKHKRHRRA